MKKKVREINDIIEELVNHPDYLHGEVFTKTDIINYLQDKYKDEFNIDIVFDRDCLTDDEWYEVEEQINNYFNNCYTQHDRPYNIDEDTNDLPEIDIRLKRFCKIKQIYF